MNRTCTISLDGLWTIEGLTHHEGVAKNAYRAGYRPADPVPARVPGIVQAALLEAGRIEDPYWEMNNEKILWVEDKEWWYFREVAVPGDVSGKKYELVFEGLTYRADVFFDGITVGRLEGSFKRHIIDITRFVKPGATQRLTLRVRALEGSSEDRPGGSVKRGMVRSTGVVAPFTYWWNWSPHLVPIGLWQSVYLKVTGGVTLRDPFVRTRIEWDGSGEAQSASLSVSADLFSVHAAGHPVRVRGRFTCGEACDEPAVPIELDVSVPPGSSKLEFAASIGRPRLWWPNGMGSHPLYRLTLELLDHDGNLLDTAETEFGIREISFERNTDDLWVQETAGQSNRLWSIVGNPYPWTIVVNGKKLFIRGTNWLPVDNLFRFTPERYLLFLDQVEAANLNLLRVWGGGIRETGTFYSLCDRKGILTWPEFWFACANYPLMPQDLFIENAVDQVKLIRNHPSIAMWSGGNEYNPDAPENRELVDALARVVSEYDPDRQFRRGSPYRGDRHGGLLMLPSRTTGKFNGDVLTGDRRLTLFRSEVAVTRSAPVLESLTRFIAPEHLWPIRKDVWQYHHAVVREQERDAKEYGGTGSLRDWLFSTQIVHGQVHRHNMEYCRQEKFRCSGCLQWSLNGSWPSFHRELIDYYGVPKPAFYAYRRASAPVIVTADFQKYVYDGNERISVPVFLVNDLHRRLGDCTVRVRIYSRDMVLFHEQEGSATVGENCSVKVLQLDWTVPGGYLEKVLFVQLEAFTGNDTSPGGTPAAGNFYWIGTSPYTRPEPTLALDGTWMFQEGQEVRETAWKETAVPGHWHFPPASPAAGESVFYRRKFSLPPEWKEAELELFCAGFEGDDEVYLNGRKIGETAEELTVEMRPEDMVYTERWAERTPGTGAGSSGGRDVEGRVDGVGRKGDRQNVRVSADPFIVPNLIKRFYRIPRDLVRRDGENTLEIRFSGEHATGISESVFIRKASSEAVQRAVIEWDNEGAYLADLRKLPEAALGASVHCDSTRLEGAGDSLEFLVRLRNDGASLAFFSYLRISGLEEAARVIMSDNYFEILPGKEKELRIRLTDTGRFTGTRTLSFFTGGWNVPERELPDTVTITFGGVSGALPGGNGTALGSRVEAGR